MRDVLGEQFQRSLGPASDDNDDNDEHWCDMM